MEAGQGDGGRKCDAAAPTLPQHPRGISKGHLLPEGEVSSTLEHPEVVCARDFAFRRSHSSGSGCPWNDGIMHLPRRAP